VSVASSGTCFGYSVRTALPLRYLRSGDGDPLEVVEVADPMPATTPALIEWTPPAQPYRARLHREADGFALWIEGAGWFRIDTTAARIEVPAGGDPIRREERLWGMPALLCFLARGDLPIHAAAVEVDGRAVVFGAPGRFGKTTLAVAFARAGYRVLAEDLTCARVDGDGVSVVPGPAMLRVRADVAAGFGLPVPKKDDERVHLVLEHAGDCRPVPLAAIVLLHPTDAGVTIEPATAAAALPDVWALSFRLPGEEEAARAFAGIASILDAVPAWYLRRPLRIETLPEVVEEVVGACLGARGRTV
jgi:hypothetical protein